MKTHPAVGRAEALFASTATAGLCIIMAPSPSRFRDADALDDKQALRF
jgi:hypothetical protein